MGELDVRMTAELFGGEPLARALAPEWAGGIYYAASARTPPPQRRTPPRPLRFSTVPSGEQGLGAQLLQRLRAGAARQYDGSSAASPMKTMESKPRSASTPSEGDVLLT